MVSTAFNTLKIIMASYNHEQILRVFFLIQVLIDLWSSDVTWQTYNKALPVNFLNRPGELFKSLQIYTPR